MVLSSHVHDILTKHNNVHASIAHILCILLFALKPETSHNWQYWHLMKQNLSRSFAGRLKIGLRFVLWIWIILERKELAPFLSSWIKKSVGQGELEEEAQWQKLSTWRYLKHHLMTTKLEFRVVRGLGYLQLLCTVHTQQFKRDHCREGPICYFQGD